MPHIVREEKRFTDNYNTVLVLLFISDWSKMNKFGFFFVVVGFFDDSLSSAFYILHADYGHEKKNVFDIFVIVVH